MPHRSFAVINSDTSESVELITFDIAGEKDIRCRPCVNGKMLMKLIAQVDSTNTSEQISGILAIFDIAVFTTDGDHPEKYTGKREQKYRFGDFLNIAIPDQFWNQLKSTAEQRNFYALLDAYDEINSLLSESEDDVDEIIPGVDPTSSLGRLHSVLDNPETEIRIDELAELVGWLVEQYVGRPTESAPNLPRGAAPTSPSLRHARRTLVKSTPKLVPTGSSTSSTD